MSTASIPTVHELTYGQPWLPAPQAEFHPGRVRLERRGDILEVEARLTDPEIHDPPAEFNDEAYRHGDVFELFLKAEGEVMYHEIHVTPSNVLLQLRFADGKLPGAIADALVWEPLLESSTERTGEGWIARYRLDLARFTQLRPIPADWRIACGRYDYQEGGKTRVISNTAPLTLPKFHRHWEWPVIHLGHGSPE